MTTRIALLPTHGTKRIHLLPDEVQAFERELRRVKHSSKAGKGSPHLVAPDCTVFVTTGKRQTKYLLFSGTVLMHERSKKTWQFYFGLLLHRWLFTR